MKQRWLWLFTNVTLLALIAAAPVCTQPDPSSQPATQSELNQVKVAVDTLSDQFTHHKSVISEKLTSFMPSMVPIGGIIAYIGKKEEIGTNWRICDGAIIDDANSPMNGIRTPIINDYRYLIGVPSQQEVSKEHGSNKWTAPGKHTHHMDFVTRRSDVRTYPWVGTHALTNSNSTTLRNHGHRVWGDTDGAGSSGSHDHGEKRPLSLGVHWILRIR